MQHIISATEQSTKSSRMDPARLNNHSPPISSDLIEPDSEELQLRVEFFRKLGYSSNEVKAALKKLGLNTDTNSVLGELVRNRTTAAPSMSDGDERNAGTQMDPLLPQSWVTGPSRVSPQPKEQKNTDSELRPVVIDGSNVAMR